MEIKYYPGKESVEKAIADSDPLLALISHDGSSFLACNIDSSMEHHILLRNLGYSDADIDKYFRIILTDSSAEWTFVCPESYKGIKDRDRRIAQYFDDGIGVITTAVKEFGIDVPVNIPQRYRRHFDRLKN
jgi:hypothetical protein